MRDNPNQHHEDDMKITLNIETNDPADLERIAAALAGKEVAVTTGKPATAGAAKAATSTKTESAGTSAQTTESRAAGTAQAQETAAAASTSEGAVPTDQELISAANVAAAKVGVGGPDKLKNHIAANFKKADGSPGTLKMTAEGQRAALLDTLQKIGRGEITL